MNTKNMPTLQYGLENPAGTTSVAAQPEIITEADLETIHAEESDEMTTITEKLRGVVEYVEHCGREGQQLEVKIEGHELAVFLSPIDGGGSFQAGDTISIICYDADDWKVEVHSRAGAGSVTPLFQDQSNDERR